MVSSIRNTSSRPLLQTPAAAPAARSQSLLGDVFDSITRPATSLLGGVENAIGSVAKDIGNIPDELMNGMLFGWPGHGSGNNAGWALKNGPAVTDSTPRFNDLYSAAKSGQDTLPPNANNYVYLSVDGLYGNALPGYMAPNDDKLRSLGLDVRPVHIDTGAGVETNAQTIRDAILAASAGGKQVVLIGHSKGGVDTTAALSLYPDLKSHVRAVVTMQSPFGGTPIASDIVECPELQSLVNGAAGAILGASPQSLQDLTYDSRKAFLAAHPYPTDIPTVSLASSRRDPGSLLFLPEEYQYLRYGLKTDGLVPQLDAEVPGSQVVKLDNLDHADSTINTPSDPYDAGALTEALVTLALQGKQAA